MTNKDQYREAFEHDQRVAATHALDDALQHQGVYLTWPTVTGLVDIVSAARSAPAAPVELPEDAITVNLVKFAGLDKHTARICERIVRCLLLATAPKLPQGNVCWCQTCRPITLDDMRMVRYPECGNKRCPRATHHDNVCTGSNEPGQLGSSWEHVKSVQWCNTCGEGAIDFCRGASGACPLGLKPPKEQG